MRCFLKSLTCVVATITFGFMLILLNDSVLTRVTGGPSYTTPPITTGAKILSTPGESNCNSFLEYQSKVDTKSRHTISNMYAKRSHNNVKTVAENSKLLPSLAPFEKIKQKNLSVDEFNPFSKILE